jgi:antitoxin (DNA-binding transcriptional repressor) of toxin-antitoxin stability system
MSEAELARDLHATLAKVQQGLEIVIEQNHQPVAILKPSKPVGRPISEVLADLEARNSAAVMDDDFARDIEERQSQNPLRHHRPPRPLRPHPGRSSAS